MNEGHSPHTGMGFLAYASRSGSTFVAARIAERFDVNVVPEFQCAYWLLGERHDKPLSADGFRQAVTRDRQLSWTTQPRLDTWLEIERFPADAFKWIADEWALGLKPGHPGAATLFKIGGVMSVWPAFTRHFPRAYVINVIRDGRAVTNSLLRSPRPYGGAGTMGRGDYVHCARQWSRQVDQQTKIASTEPDRVIQLRYEDVIGGVDSALHEVGQRCGWPAGEAAREFAVADAERAIHELVDGPPVRERIEAWRAELPRAAQITVETIGSATLARHGYTSNFATATRRERLETLTRAYLRHAWVATSDSYRRLRGLEDASALRARLRHRVERLRARASHL